MNCEKCIYCIQKKKDQIYVVCSNKKLLTGHGYMCKYQTIGQPSYCAFYKTKSQQIKEEIKKWKTKKI